MTLYKSSEECTCTVCLLYSVDEVVVKKQKQHTPEMAFVYPLSLPPHQKKTNRKSERVWVRRSTNTHNTQCETIKSDSSPQALETQPLPPALSSSSLQP